MLLTAIFFAFIASSAFSSPLEDVSYLYPENNRGNRIVGGFPVDIEDHPFIGSLQRINHNTGLSSHSCGVIIISADYVLCAAHCTIGALPTNLRIRVGSSFHATGGEWVNVRRVINHPSYSSSTIDFDFSLLGLSNRLNLNHRGIGKIRLPRQDEHFPDLAYTRTCGWGNTLNVNESRDRLRCVNVPIVSQPLCAQAYAPRAVTDRMICAGYLGVGGKDACQG
jgi:trypsin